MAPPLLLLFCQQWGARGNGRPAQHLRNLPAARRGARDPRSVTVPPHAAADQSLVQLAGSGQLMRCDAPQETRVAVAEAGSCARPRLTSAWSWSGVYRV